MTDENKMEFEISADPAKANQGLDSVAASIEKSVSRMEAMFDRLAKNTAAAMDKTAGATANMSANTAAASTQLSGVMGQLQTKLEGFSAGIQSKLDPVMGAFSRLNGVMAAVGGVLAGGAAFKSAIDETRKLAAESNQLSRALGLSVEEASILNLALGDIGSSADEYTGAFIHFARQLKENEEGLQAMGLKTRDANGHLRDSRTLMSEAVGIVGQYKAGLDQTTASMNFFGRDVETAMKLQKLSGTVMEEATEKARALGLVMTTENKVAAKEFKAAMNDVDDVMSALKKAIGSALMPVLTELGNWFSSIGPGAVVILKGAIGGLVTSFLLVQAVIKEVGLVIIGVFKTITGIGEGLGALLTVPLRRIPEVLSGMKSRVAEAWGNVGGAMLDEANKTKEKIWNLFAEGTPAGKASTGSKTMPTSEKPAKEAAKEEPLFKTWDGVLAQAKAAYAELQLAQGSFQQYSKQMELEYWQGILAVGGHGQKDMAALQRKTGELRLQLAQEAFGVYLADLNAELGQYRTNHDARLKILTDIAAAMKQKYGDDSKEYKEAQGKIKAEMASMAEQSRRIADIRAQASRDMALAEIDAEEQAAQTAVSLRQISAAQMIEVQQQLEDRRYAIRAEALQQQKAQLEASADTNLEAIAKNAADIEALETQHQAKLNDIRAKATVESAKYTTEAIDATRNSFATMVGDMLKGTKTMTDAFKSFAQSVINELINIQAKKMAASATDSASSTIGSILGNIFGGGSPTPAGTSPATVAAYGPQPGGFTLPSFAVGTNRVPRAMIAQLHTDEAVVPAAYNPAVGGAGGGGTANVTVNQNIRVDSRSDMATIMGAMARAKQAAVDEITSQLMRGGHLNAIVRGV